MDSGSPTLLTKQAAAYIRAAGKPASASLLRKLRGKKPDDPGPHGPKFFRDNESGYCLYRREDLDAYLEQWRAQLRPMAPRDQPERLAREHLTDQAKGREPSQLQAMLEQL